MTLRFLEKGNTWFLFIISFISCLLALYIKAYYISSASDLLWAEDAPIFIAQAKTYGVLSFLIPYAGYLHTTIRIFAYIVSFFSLAWQPFALLISTFCLYAMAVFVIIISLKSIQVRPIFIYCAVVLLFLQPTDGEILLNLTNTQWIIGPSLIIYAMTYQEENTTFWNVLIALLFGLSGPFSIFLFPVLCVKFFIFKQKVNTKFVLFLLVAVLIQFCLVITTTRSLTPETHIVKNLAVVIEAFQAIMLGYLYRMDSYFLFFAMTGIFTLIIAALIKNYKHQHRIVTIENIAFGGLFLISGLLLFSTLISVIDKPLHVYNVLLEGMLSNSRYLFIPHYLLIVGTLILSRNSRLISLCFVICFAVIAYADYSFLKKDEINFRSFLNFSNYQKVFVTTNPIENKLSHRSIWIMELKKDTYKALSDDNIYTFERADLKSSDAEITQQDDDFQITFKQAALSDKTTIEFMKPIDCKDTSDIGIDFSIAASSPVKIDFSTQPWEKESPIQSGFLYQNEVIDTLQIAFPFIGEKAKLVLTLTSNPLPLKPSPDSVDVKISKLKLFCLPK